MIVFVATKKQASYSQRSVNTLLADGFVFDVTRDIIDSNSIYAAAVGSLPGNVTRAVGALESYLGRVAHSSLNPSRTFNPPEGTDLISSNLIEVYFPNRLFVADLVPEAKSTRLTAGRKAVRAVGDVGGAMLPSDFEVMAGRLITFHDLQSDHHAFARVIDQGTITSMWPSEFFDQDIPQERAFKSLLRFLLQSRVQKHRLQWMPDDELFIFLPSTDHASVRRETWRSDRSNTRVVFERKRRRAPSEGFLPGKHFAFHVDFLKAGERWFASITPDWYFSANETYVRSQYGEELISWLKRREVNRTVFDHFRFLSTWLRNVHDDDMLLDMSPVPKLAFGEIVSFQSNVMLPDQDWLPVRALDDGNELDLFRMAEKLAS